MSSRTPPSRLDKRSPQAGAQGPGLPRRLGSGPDAGYRPDVAGHVLGAGEAVDLAQFEHHKDRHEWADAGDGHQPADPRIVPPPADHLNVETTDLLIQQAQQRPAVFPDRAGDWAQGERRQFPLALHAQPGPARGG